MSNLKTILICFFGLVRSYLKLWVEFLSSGKISTFISYPRRQIFSSNQKLILNQGPRGRRYYSTVPPKTEGVKYTNADTDKLRILTENTGKSGIYVWTNLKNGKRYVGSSSNLKNRFRSYYNINRLMNEYGIISRALLSYGYSNFSL